MTFRTITSKSRQTTVTAVALSAVLGLAACGGGSSAGTNTAGSAQAKFERAALNFARCMREQGVDMPDPKRGAGGFTITPETDTSQGNSERFRQADKACRHHMKGVQPPAPSQKEMGEFKQAALAHARCMRKHGIDIPDPRVGQGNEVAIELPPGFRPDDPRYERASDACRKESPMPGPGGQAP